jgi:hypothetical protein
MSNQDAPHALRRAIVAPEPLVVGSARYDYADAFEIQLPAADTRSPEQLFRAALDQASSALRWAVPILLRHVLLLRLGPVSSPDHVLGWQILVSEPDVIHLEAVGSLIRADIIGRRVGPTDVVFTTFVFYARRAPARVIWAIVAPVHRKTVGYLLERAVATANRR